MLLAACASDEPRGPAGGGVQAERSESSGPGAPGPRTRPSLFISPAGEPFRAGPGDAYPVGVWFRQADADGDGKLNRDEFTADAARFFQKLDANHDGVIDGAEVKAYETEMVPEITADRPGAGGAQGGSQGSQRSGAGGQGSGGQGGGGRRGRRGGGGGFGGGQNGQGGQGQGGGSGGATPQAEGAAPYGLLGEREPVAAADLELNSRITLASFRTKAAQRFGRLDVDGKGYLLLAELPKTPAQKGGRRGRGGQPRPPQSPPNGG
ncbi:MAG TPA: EF-hand domain-containing protein [Caulobacteraceae bacterium]